MRRSPLLVTATLIGALAAGCAGGQALSPSAVPTSSLGPTSTESPSPTARPTAHATPAAALAGEVAYAAGADSQVFLLDLATGETRQLTELTPADAELVSRGPLAPATSCGFGVHSLEWSPDGSRLAFTYGGCDAVIYLLDLDGTLTRLAEGYGPTWSPDGSRIVFRPNMPFCLTSQCGEPPHPGAWNLQVVDVDAGTGPRPLTADETTSGAGQPHYSPDGSLLAFTGPIPDPAEHPDLFSATYVSNADGSRPTLVASGAWPAAWLPDGRLVIVEERTGELHAVDLTSTEADSLGVAMGPSAVAPDGSRLILTNFEAATGATEVMLATLDDEVLAERAGIAGCWAPDSRAAVIIEPDLSHGFVVIDRDGRELGTFAVPGAESGVLAIAWRPGT